MSDEIRKVIAYELLRRVPELNDCNELAGDILSTLGANGYVIAPSPESITDEQTNAALRKDAEVTALVRERKMTMGDAFRAVYRTAITPPKEPE